jgi:hypothetical protein
MFLSSCAIRLFIILEMKNQFTPKMAIAIADYRASGPGDIEFLRGDQILVISKPFPEWWEGEVHILVI